MTLLLRQLKMKKRKRWMEIILDLRTRIFLVLLLCVFIGLCLPVFISKFLGSRKDGNLLKKHCLLEHELRINCLPGVPADKENREECEKKACCWDVIGYTVPSCYHTHPTNYTYKISSKIHDIINITPKYNLTPIGTVALQLAQVKITPWSDYHLRVSMSSDSSFDPLEAYNYEKPSYNNSSERFYDVFFGKSPNFYIQIRRKSTDSIPIFNTFYGPLILSEGFSEISTLLPSYNIYGMGQAPKKNFRHVLKYANKFVLFNTAEYTNETHPEVYMASGAHPFYMVVEPDGKSHGVLLLTSSPAEMVSSGMPAVTFRTTTNFLDLHIFFGPTPSDVVKQLMQFVGKPRMPPYWALGYHSCRNTPDLSQATEYLNFTKGKGIPHDSDCGSVQLLSSAFTVDKNLKDQSVEFYETLSLSGRKHLLVQSPHFDAKKIFMHDSELFVRDVTSGKPFVGYLPNGREVVYPDFFNLREITPWLRTKYQTLLRSIKFDALILGMNTPINTNVKESCGKNPQNVLFLEPNLSKGTICMESLHTRNETHFNIHNLYGYKHALAVRTALQNQAKYRNKRKFLTSFSTFTGSGAFTGQWNGILPASWETLKNSLIQSLDFSLYGIPLNGIPICGTSGPIDVDLCTRWIQLAAFQPLMMSYRIDKEELLVKNRRLVTVAANMIQLRYSLLPYLYTLFYRVERFGGTVLQSVFFEFPGDVEALKVDEQFLWGSGLLVSPVLQPATQKTRSYFPPGCWFDYYTGKMIAESKTGIYKELIALEYHINLHIRGGYVIPSQEAGLNTKMSRQNSFTLSIALSCSEKANYVEDYEDRILAHGELYIDDGESENVIENGLFLLVNITVIGKRLSIIPAVDGRKILQKNPVSTNLETVHMYGFSFKPSSVIVDKHMFEHVYKPKYGILSLHGINLDLSLEHIIEWEQDEL